MSRPRRMRREDGFTMVELLCALVVLNLLVAGITKLFLGQNQMVNSLEEWCEGEPEIHLALEPDPMARGLGVPATLTTAAGGPVRGLKKTPYEVKILSIQRRISKEQATAVFHQVEVEVEEEDDDKGKKPKKKGDKKGKGRGGRG